MKIERIGDSYFTHGLIDCKLYVRKNLTVVKATEWFYVYVGDNSYLPISSMILPEDGKLLLEHAENYTGEIELITEITDSRGGHRNIYLRMEQSDQTEEGVPLFLITLFDIRDMEQRNANVEANLGKYRHFMTLNSDLANEFYFEVYIMGEFSEPISDYVASEKFTTDMFLLATNLKWDGYAAVWDDVKGNAMYSVYLATKTSPNSNFNYVMPVSIKSPFLMRS